MDTEPLASSLATLLLSTSLASKIWLVALWAVGIISLFLTAFTSASLASLLALDPADISPFEERGEARSVNRLRKMLRKPSMLLITLLGSTFFFFSLALASIFYALLKSTPGAALSTSIESEVMLVVTFIIFVGAFFTFGILVPIVVLSRTEFLVKNAVLLSYLSKLALPFTAFSSFIANLLGNIRDLPEKMGIKELGVYGVTAEEEEMLEDKEREMISAIVEMGEKTAREIMTPRVDIVALDVEEPTDKLLKKIAEASFSRFPVFEGTIDNVIGIIHIRDLMRAILTKKDVVNLREIMLPPTFVPDTKKVDELLHDLQTEKTHLAIVTDEYGGVEGLITIEDILEEIVGEIHDEYDVDMSEPVSRTATGAFIVNAMLPLDEFQSETGLVLEEEEHDTLGGLLFAKFGRIPKKGETVYINNIKFTILQVEKNRIRLVQAERMPED